MDELVNELISLMHAVPFIEHYSHTNCDMYKINNMYTNYNNDKWVLSPVSEGFTHAVQLAIETFKKERPDIKYFQGERA